MFLRLTPFLRLHKVATKDLESFGMPQVLYAQTLVGTSLSLSSLGVEFRFLDEA